MLIKDLNERDTFTQPLMITQALNGVSNNGKPYLSLTLQDKSGSIDGKLWDVNEAQEKMARVGYIVEVNADVLKYKGTLQLRIKELSIKSQREYNLPDFIQASDISKVELQKQIGETIDSINNPILKQVVDALFERHYNDFYVYPAATKNHHDFVGGLATHTLEMCNIGLAMCNLFPQINRDLLISGILIHDIGKIEEYVSPIVAEYSTPGRLLGHISILESQLYEIAKQLQVEESEEVMLLRHMVLSHHGRLDFGSPVVPQFLEAELLSIIDNMDARLQMFTKHLDTIEEGQFSGRIFPLENRMIYKPKLTK